MFEIKKEVSGNYNKEKVWLLYSNVAQWLEWDKSLEKITLSGDFLEGTTGTMTNKGMPSIEFKLSEVTEGKSFTTTSMIGPVKIEVSHYLIKENEEKLKIEHGVKVSGPDDNKNQEIGLAISGSFDQALETLGELSK